MAECWRNITATGALPLAATDNLNFGNPEKPEIMSQLVHAIKGIGEACTALDFPIVSGNVSLYNETNGQAIMPTPTIGGVGLIADWAAMARIAFSEDNECILLIGAPSSWERILDSRCTCATFTVVRTARRRRSISPMSARSAISCAN